MIARFNIPPILFQLPIYIYSFLGVLYWMFFLEQGMGDEGLMAQYLDEAKEHGLIWLLKSGNFSVPHAILVFPLSLVLPSYLSLRILSLLGTIFIFIRLTSKHQLSQNSIAYHLLFYLASGSFLLGTNDNLFICFITVFISEILLFYSKKTDKIPGIAWFCLISAFFTREMAIIYLPLLIGMTLVIFKSRKFKAKEIIIVMGSVLFWIILNIPSIAHNGTLGFDNKNMAKQNGITWPQRQYLSQLYANQGLIPEFSHVSWEETRTYLDKNGSDSLPATTFESLTYDINLTWKEFWKDLAYLVYSGFRQVGIVVLLPFFVFLISNKKDQALRMIGLGQLLQMLIFSVIIISYIEIRWLAPVFILGVLGLDLLIKNQPEKSPVDFVNKIILIALSIYGIGSYIRLIEKTSAWANLFA